MPEAKAIGVGPDYRGNGSRGGCPTGFCRYVLRAAAQWDDAPCALTLCHMDKPLIGAQSALNLFDNKTDFKLGYYPRNSLTIY